MDSATLGITWRKQEELDPSPDPGILDDPMSCVSSASPAAAAGQGGQPLEDEDLLVVCWGPGPGQDPHALGVLEHLEGSGFKFQAVCPSSGPGPQKCRRT